VSLDSVKMSLVKLCVGSRLSEKLPEFSMI
jgi:hypothetical protein